MKRSKKVTAKAKCLGFDIHLEATIFPKELNPNEIKEVKRMIKHQLTTSISKLPFSEVYPFEVQVR